MSEKKIIKDFRPGQMQLSAAHLNQIVRAVRQAIVTEPPLTMTTTPDNIFLGIEKIEWGFFGEIDAAGKVDWSDSRYYVKKQRINNTDEDVTSQVTAVDDLYPSAYQYTVTNLPEMSDQTHILGDGQEVLVFKVEDDYLYRYVMSETPWLGYHATRDPHGSDTVFHAKSDVAGSDLAGDPTDSSDYYMRGWMYIDSDLKLRPWMSVRSNAMLPAGAGQYKVLQLDALNEPIWDWVRAH